MPKQDPHLVYSDGPARFRTDMRYSKREEKAAYVWTKYEALLRGRVILDVGADAGYLRKHVDAAARYTGIGYGEGLDEQVNLELGPLRYADNSFDTVLCLDVLEHLESCHRMFAELARVTRGHVIISLPNPWHSFWVALTEGPWRAEQPIKFYGLPARPPEDRHRWFFSHTESLAFVRENAAACGLKVVQFDARTRKAPSGLRALALRQILSRDVNLQDLLRGTLWAVLEKPRA